jgi:hypothetical protein
MKVYRLITLLSALILLPVLVFADQAFVITKQNAVRQSCRFFAPVKASVSYNDLLDIVSTEGDWFKVRYRGVEGCIHKSAIQKKTASFTGAPVSGRSGGSVSQGETAMAGKGFNPQVEASYKGKHPEMRYDLVDKIEGYPVPDKELVRFITIGGLIEP